MTVQSSSNNSAPGNGERITYFGLTDSRGKKVRFGIKEKDRSKHTYVIGKTGMGKSTLLENMAIQDIQNDEGIAFIDPHGGTAEKLLEYVPEHRVKDVLYFAPFDIEYPVSFNVMEDIGAEKRHLVVSGLMSAFTKLFGEESFSDRMQYILQNIILALLEYPGSTMLGINKMLVDKEYRNKVIANITDPSVKTYWTKEYAGYTERFAAEAIPAIQNKIGQFTSNPLVRNIIGQEKPSFDLRDIMDNKKILIVNLSKGRVGENNANLIGSMLITKIYLAAMSRADASPATLNKLPNFFLYVDEFQSFANKSFADILSEARKYKLNLTIAHQYVEQMEEEVRDAVFGNVGTTIAFRVGPFDAEVLETVFAPHFTAENLVNLGLRQIYLSLMIDGVGSPPFSATTMPPIEAPEISYRDVVIASSRKTFGTPRNQVEDGIRAWHETSVAANGGGSTPKEAQQKPPNTITVRADGTKITDPPKNISEGNAPISEKNTVAKPIPTNIGPVAQQSVMKEPTIKVPSTALPRIVSENNGAFTKPPRVMNRETESGRVISESQSHYARDTRPPKPNKGPTDQNLNQLREALKSVMNETGMIYPNQSGTNQTMSKSAEQAPKNSSAQNPAQNQVQGAPKPPKVMEGAVSLKDAILQAQKEKMERVMSGEGQVAKASEIVEKAKPVQESVTKPAESISTVPPPSTPPAASQTAPREVKEIPEEELRKILDIK